MSKYDGTDKPLTMAEVLVELVRRHPWGSEVDAREAEEVVRKELGLWNEPDKPVNPHESAAERELAELKERHAKLEAAARERQAADELAELRRRNAELEAAAGSGPGDDGTGGSGAEDPSEDKAAKRSKAGATR